MKYYALYATRTRREARALTRELNRLTVPGFAQVARPLSGALRSPNHYLVLTRGSCDVTLLRFVRDQVKPPRFPRLVLAQEWAVDALIRAIEALTRLIRKLKGARS